MATCYYCMNQATQKRWVTVSRGRSGRLYITKRGIRGGSVSRGATTSPRGLCAACAAYHDKVQNVTGLIVVAAVVAFIGFIIYADNNQPDYVDHTKYPVVASHKDTK